MSTRTEFPGLRREGAGWSDLSWGGALPAVVRLLADRRAQVALPTCPLVRCGEPPKQTFGRALGYWTALDHLLRYQLGWTFPAQGLARWLDEGRPADARPLALVRQVWLGDGFLTRYLAWRVQKCTDHLPSPWMERVAQADYEYGAEGTPLGPWQLHLEEPGMHALAPSEEAPPKLAWLHPFEPSAPFDVLFGDEVKPPGRLVDGDEAVLLLHGSLEAGWYGALRAAPTPHVRVVHQQHGLLGRFRLSTVSGRWHTVSEEVHAWGVRPS